MTRFRDGVLNGRVLALAGCPESIRERVEELGASVEELDARLDESAGEEWARAHPGVQVVVFDAGPSFADGGTARLQQALERGWTLIRAVAVQSLIPSGSGKVILIAPRAGTGPQAGAARAALENLARTLSVEWARYAITATMIAPGEGTDDAQVADLVAFLASAAGDYYTGCRFSLGSVPVIHAS